ncbi:hypothetical protein RN98_03410 [Fusobacterium animalis]|uniref:Uncharacterized protein n=1 Tax=Fusobacterium animalis TaxID=76859 RepID=A0A0M3URV3_9FUSO|nr:hypothetical protein RN98_03410 [Fusobacterium animalis]
MFVAAIFRNITDLMKKPLPFKEIEIVGNISLEMGIRDRLRAKYPFKTLLKIAGISKSVYFTILIKKILMRRIKMLLKKSKEFTMRIKEDMVIAE